MKHGQNGGNGPTTTPPTSTPNLTTATTAGRQVVDFSEARTQRLEDKRRKTERILFKHLIGVYIVAGDRATRSIELADVSEDGCSFQVPFDPRDPWPTESVDFPIRLYFSQDTYLEIFVKVQNSSSAIEENGQHFTRYGCRIDQGTAAYPAYAQFVRFLKLYAEHAHKDLGKGSVFYL